MKSPCIEPRCPDLATPKGRGRCQRHARERDKSLNRAGRKVYSTKRWEITRRKKLHDSPICERCNKELADTVHHRVDLAEGGDEFAMSNLESCCGPCHSKETRSRQVRST